jgi:hypothetical protein
MPRQGVYLATLTVVVVVRIQSHPAADETMAPKEALTANIVLVAVSTLLYGTTIAVEVDYELLLQTVSSIEAWMPIVCAFGVQMVEFGAGANAVAPGSNPDLQVSIGLLPAAAYVCPQLTIPPPLC